MNALVEKKTLTSSPKCSGGRLLLRKSLMHGLIGVSTNLSITPIRLLQTRGLEADAVAHRMDNARIGQAVVVMNRSARNYGKKTK